MNKLRNIAIIAHVDHGKTTLVDQLLTQSGSFRQNQRIEERIMDSNALERERGITILAKCASVDWEGIRINIVDTPGHADFGGEVERILSMVDGALVLVDSAEGPMPQTKFVTQKALALGLKPIVIINKIDRTDQRALEVNEQIFDLFADLGATNDQLDYPLLFCSAKEGWASEDLSGKRENLEPLFRRIVDHILPPNADVNAPFAMLASILEYDSYLGRVLTGRIERGSAILNAPVKAVNANGEHIEVGRLTKLFAFRGVERVSVKKAHAGDIIAIAGLNETTVSHTVTALENGSPVPALSIDPPTVSMNFSINDSPFTGRDGDKITSRLLSARLRREAEGNVAIQVVQTEDEQVFEVRGRGELQFGVLIETLRREGFELSVSRPKVIYRNNIEQGVQEEPLEEVVIDVDDDYVGPVVEELSRRKGEMTDLNPSGAGKTRLVFLAPSRGLIGYHGKFLNDTSGTGVMSRVFHSYVTHKGSIAGRRNGVLISNNTGKSVPFALWNLEERGELFIGAGVAVYKGMIIGEHTRGNDLDVNPLKNKKLTNIRASGNDDAVRLTTPRLFRLEEAISYIDDDELVEVTPHNIRLRKRFLDIHRRKKEARAELKEL